MPAGVAEAGARFSLCMGVAAPLAAAYFRSWSRLGRSDKLRLRISHVTFDHGISSLFLARPVDGEQVDAENIERVRDDAATQSELRGRGTVLALTTGPATSAAVTSLRKPPSQR